MASAPLQTGTLLNHRYNILGVVGQGGMGTVYKAEHVRLHAIVAVKEIHGLSGDEAQQRQELDRCEHEAQFLVKLNHPHLPKVTDAFIENECFYLVMDFIEGVTLDARLSALGGKPVDVAQSVEWGLQIADVLEYLHSQDPPIIFRDLKPANVMVQANGGIKLIDFGIARHFQPGASKDTSLLGSVGYSPPEQFGRGQTDARSDVYAFGATLHHLLTGRDPGLQPFKFPPARTFNPLVPSSLSHLLDVCLDIDPNKRPENMHVVAMQLLIAREELAAQNEAMLAQQNTVSASDLAGISAVKTHLDPLQLAAKERADQKSRESAFERSRGGAVAPSPGPERLPPAVRVTPASQSGPRRSAPASAASSERRSATWLIVPALLALIGGGAAVAFMANRPAHSPGAASNSAIVTSPLVVDSAPSPDTPSGGEPTPASGSAPTTPAVSPATGNSPTESPVAPGSSGSANTNAFPGTIPATSNISLQTALLPLTGDMLPIAVSGSIKGQGNTQLKLAIYFFDAKGLPVEAIDTTNLAYTNSQKYLCAYKTVAIPSDDHAVQEMLHIPAHLLLGSPQAAPFTYEVMLFQDGRPLPIYKTGSIDLPPATYGGANPVSNAPAASTGTGAGSGRQSVLNGGRVGN